MHRQNRQFKYNYGKRSKYGQVKITPYFDLCLADSSLEVCHFLTVALLELVLRIHVVLKCFLSLLELPLELQNMAMIVLRLGLH